MKHVYFIRSMHFVLIVASIFLLAPSQVLAGKDNVQLYLNHSGQQLPARQIVWLQPNDFFLRTKSGLIRHQAENWKSYR